MLGEEGQREADLMRAQKEVETGVARAGPGSGGHKEADTRHLWSWENWWAGLHSAPARHFFSSLVLTTVFQVTHFTNHFINLYSLLIILGLLSHLPLKTRIWVFLFFVF